MGSAETPAHGRHWNCSEPTGLSGTHSRRREATVKGRNENHTRGGVLRGGQWVRACASPSGLEGRKFLEALSR